jgi:hypothetical protein
MRGCRAAAVLYTLIESWKLGGVDVLSYLADVLVRVATHPASRIDELLPANWAQHFAAPVVYALAAHRGVQGAAVRHGGRLRKTARLPRSRRSAPGRPLRNAQGQA